MDFLRFLFFSALISEVGCLTFSNSDFGNVQVGKPFNISWTAQGSVNLTLVANIDSNRPEIVKLIGNIATGISESSFGWIPLPSLDLNYTYAVELQDGTGAQQFSKYFQLVGKNSIVPPSVSASERWSTTQLPAPTSTSLPSGAEIPVSAASTNTPAWRSQSGTKTRIAVTVTIVTLLIIVLVALIFFEHGKRVSARSEEAKFSYEGQDHGLGICGGSSDTILGMNSKVMELDSISLSERSCKGNRQVDKKKIVSMKSIYELGC